MSKLKILELFGGIGACSKALERLNIDYEIADYVEIDKYAVKSFNAMQETNFEPQDIRDWDKDIEVDLIMHGSPCQDFSLAGKQAGGDKDSGTRSSLMYETIRIVEKLKPKYVIWENVKNLLSKKHRHNFDSYLETMTQLGYVNYYQILNAKDYGIPQNRERVFTISIRDDSFCWNSDGNPDDYDEDYIANYYKFPPKQELKLRLKDLLEDEVDEKYYLSDEIVNKIKYKFDEENVLVGGMQANQSVKKDGICTTLTSSMGAGGGYVPMVSRKYGVLDNEKSTHQAGSVYDENGLSPTLDTMQGWRQPCIEIKNATKKGYLEAIDGDSVNLEQPNSKTRRGRVGFGVSQTLTTSCNQGVIVKDKTICLNSKAGRNGIKGLQPSLKDRIYDSNGIATCCATSNFFMPNYTDGLRIRKLTPNECWRLMGFSDEDFEKAEKVNSNTQLYKQAGNSIVVNVLEAILKELLRKESDK